MKQALISPQETSGNGYRVVEVTLEAFPVAEPLFWVECDDTVTMEHTYVDGTFIKHETPVVIPQVVSRFQARAALYNFGLLTAVETLMASADTPMLAKLAWADAQTFKRNSPTVLTLGSALGLTEAQLDELFVAAAKIEA